MFLLSVWVAGLTCKSLKTEYKKTLNKMERNSEIKWTQFDKNEMNHTLCVLHCSRHCCRHYLLSDSQQPMNYYPHVTREVETQRDTVRGHTADPGLTPESIFWLTRLKVQCHSFMPIKFYCLATLLGICKNKYIIR